MKRMSWAAMLWVAVAVNADARGLLIPVEKTLPPLAMLNHHVTVSIEDQVAVTKVDQTFRNHTGRQLEATYVFPVPKGASVKEFAMWVDGKRVKGELLPAAEARKVYTEIVRRTQDPGLLEYIGSDLLSLKVFPVQPKSDQKVEVSFSSVASKDHEVVAYTYPLKSDGKAASTLEDFTLKVALKSQHPIVNIYSPTHAIGVQRANDREASISFDKQQAILDKDFQLFYTTSGKDVGLTALAHRPISAEDGYFMLLISPRAELSKDQQVPRDIVFVMDTSGSMLADGKIDQAKKALKHGLESLTEIDRFAVINFSTTVNRYRDGLIQASKEQVAEAKKWVDRLEATGGTAINDALAAALDLRSKDDSRTFTLVFMTDGKPTIGETNIDKILANARKKNTANTRVFTFGVGHDLNASFLDTLATESRAISSYVRPEEDIEVKVSSFFGKINRPVLANLKIGAGNGITLSEVYPPQLPDLFHGDQLVVLGRYSGAGHAAVTLTGSVGKETRDFVYEIDFPGKVDGKNFVEDLWARRKVGYLLEQIRLNGEKEELVKEVTALAKKYGIATPYTSWLIMPDAPMPVAAGPGGAKGEPGKPEAPAALARANGEQLKLAEFARQVQTAPGDVYGNRGRWEDANFAKLPAPGAGGRPMTEREKGLQQAKDQKGAYDAAYSNFRGGQWAMNQSGKLGVDLSCAGNDLKCQTRLTQTALRNAYSRNCVEIGGVWIDEGFNPKNATVAVKAQSNAYFRILERHPQMKEVYQLGNHVVWQTPNGANLVIDSNDGKEELSDKEIDTLFAAK